MGRIDPAVARLAEWADQDPAAMLRLICDVELQRLLKQAIEDVVEDVVEGSAGDLPGDRQLDDEPAAG